MNKLILSTLITSTLAISSYANATSATATAQWQGIIPTVTQGATIAITGKDGAETLPIGQLLFKPDGNINTSIIELEARAVADSVIGDIKTTADWVIQDVQMRAAGQVVTGVNFDVYDDTTKLASSASGVTTAIASSADDTGTIRLRVESTNDASDKLSAYSGQDAAVSVTVVVTDVTTPTP